MTNPWARKNPMLSLWLSAANAAAGKARGPAMAQMRRRQAEVMKQSMAFWIDAWTPPALKTAEPKRRTGKRP
jgi:hypothetical protein